MVQPTYRNVVVAPIPAPEFKGFYGFGQPELTMHWELGLVVQVLQYVSNRGYWAATPARYPAKQVAESTPGQPWSIDSGQGWELSAENADAFREYAKKVLVEASVKA